MKRRRWVWSSAFTLAIVVFLAASLPFACDRAVGNRSIDLTGIVTDESGRPLDGVLVNAELSRYRRFPPPLPMDDHSVVSWSESATTDDRGRFSFRARGTHLRITSITKSGYLLPRKVPPTQYSYQGVTPAVPSPVRFSMWKRRGTFSLSEKATRWPVSRGRTIAIALNNESSTGGTGDLQVTFDQVGGLWTVTMEAIEGGLQDATDAFLFLAPSEGYEAKRTFTLTSARSWAGPMYIKCHNGQVYAVAMISMLGMDSKQPYFYLNYRANRSGQPNLEPDHPAPFDP
jgi:hypothetical protein